jgi:hypothetical protein
LGAVHSRAFGDGHGGVHWVHSTVGGDLHRFVTNMMRKSCCKYDAQKLLQI